MAPSSLPCVYRQLLPCCMKPTCAPAGTGYQKFGPAAVLTLICEKGQTICGLPLPFGVDALDMPHHDVISKEL